MTTLPGFRDLETGNFISRDPLGFVDGPNMYAYVMQNPWTNFDPLGLRAETEMEKKELDKLDKKAADLKSAAKKYRDQAEKAIDDKQKEKWNEKAFDAIKEASKIKNSARSVRKLIDAMTDDTNDISGIISGKDVPWVMQALREYGISEIKGVAQDNARIAEYFRAAKQSWIANERDFDSRYPWCAAFVSWCMVQSGSPTLPSQGNATGALNWQRHWGENSGPIMGSIASFSTGGGSGHVGFLMGINKNYAYLPGGNQGDSVNFSRYPIAGEGAKKISYRMPLGSDRSNWQSAPILDKNISSGSQNTR